MMAPTEAGRCRSSGERGLGTTRSWPGLLERGGCAAFRSLTKQRDNSHLLQRNQTQQGAWRNDSTSRTDIRDRKPGLV